MLIVIGFSNFNRENVRVSLESTILPFRIIKVLNTMLKNSKIQFVNINLNFLNSGMKWGLFHV